MFFLHATLLTERQIHPTSNSIDKTGLTSFDKAGRSGLVCVRVRQSVILYLIIKSQTDR